MAEYIEFEATKQAIDRTRSVYHRARNFNAVSVIDNVFGEIKEIPAADVAPVVHGHWTTECYNIPICSICGTYVSKDVYNSKDFTPRFCPHCGAKMDEEAYNGT